MQERLNLDETEQPEKLTISDYTRREIGLVNNLRKARPQPNKKNNRRVGGSKASKILRRQR